MTNSQSLTAILVASSAAVAAAAAEKKGPAEKKGAGKARKEPEPKKKWMTESEALAVINSNASLHDKAVALQDLAPFATAKSVPALAALLSHEHLSDYARSGLEGIPDASAGAALRNALGKLNGRQLAGAVHSLGVRREKAAVADLQKLALDSKRGVQAEAVSSLGLIGSADAAKTLQKLLTDSSAEVRTAAVHASFTAAEQLAKAGNSSAARGLLDAIGRAKPAEHIAAAAKSQASALKR